VKFLIDEMFSPAVARHLTDLGYDAQHVRDVGLSGRTDDEVLDRAIAEDRASLDAEGPNGQVSIDVVRAVLERELRDLPDRLVRVLAALRAAAGGRNGGHSG